MIKAAMFDMDGLLLDSERIYMDAFEAVGRAADLPIMHRLPDIFRMMVGKRDADSGAILEREIGPYIARDRFDALWHAEITGRMAGDIPVKKGAIKLLTALKDADIPAGVVTSTLSAKAHSHLERAGLRHLVDHIIGGDQVRDGKPSPEGYLAMAAHLGASPDSCAAFEDSDTGTRAAVASGARVVQVPDIMAPHADVLALGHHVAPDLITGARHLGLPV
ncbi:HAD family hydrolase [Yoonia sp. 208BN28-4]|uniref:HAD family hydrolase n=1 Tax=Yoonia sp. 208BN28-4 TaxID=3126505 RepID=UPI0030A0F667